MSWTLYAGLRARAHARTTSASCGRLHQVRCAPRDANYYDKRASSAAMAAGGSTSPDAAAAAAAGRVDWASVEPGTPSALLRPELLRSLAQVAATLKAADDAAASRSGKDVGVAGGAVTEAASLERPPRPSWLPEGVTLPHPLEFNVNVFTPVARLFDDAQMRADEAVARAAAAYLAQVCGCCCCCSSSSSSSVRSPCASTQFVVPSLSFALVRGAVAPLDGDALVRAAALCPSAGPECLTDMAACRPEQCTRVE
jgi:hypothetical protein